MKIEEALELAGLGTKDVIDWRHAQVETGYEYSSHRKKGIVILTKSEFIFVKEKGWMSKAKVHVRKPISKIKNARHMCILGTTIGGKRYKMRDAKEFVQSIKNLAGK